MMTTEPPAYSSSLVNIVTSAPPVGACRSDLLDRLRQLFNFMLASYFRVMFLRLDPRFPAERKYPIDNGIFTNFLESYRRHLVRKNLPSCHLWVREHDSTTVPLAPNHHYHLALVIAMPPEGSDHEPTKADLFGLADRLWSINLGIELNIQNGLVDHCDRPTRRFPLGNGVIVDRGKRQWPERVEYCYEWGTYLAKLESKETLPPWIRSMGSSRLPHQGHGN